jgi:putative tricarboxylic transport membrane protein
MDFVLHGLEIAAPAFFTAENLLLLTAGVASGLIIGAVPGFSTSMGMVLFLPFTFGMSPVAGLSTMIGILVGGTSGAMVGAMLLGIPGTPASYATTFDGFPLLRKGQPGLALGLGVWASFFGGVIGWCVLVVLAPTIAVVGLEFGPWDYFNLVFFALTIAASLSGRQLVKGLIAGGFGVLVAAVGTDPINNVARLDFGTDVLAQGFDIMPLLVGLFAFAQLMEDLEDAEKAKRPMIPTGKAQAVKIEHLAAIKEILRQPVNVVRSALIGVFVGVVPAVGAQISNIVAYDQAKKASTHPDRFGTGVTEGIVAPEAANNATQGGSLSILMSLGIPGDVVTVVVLGALTIHNVAPSPTFIIDEPLIAYTIFLAFLCGTFVMVALQAFGLRVFVLITRLPIYMVAGVILFCCALGVFAWSNIVDVIWTVFWFGILGYVMRLGGFPIAPFVLGVVLGGVAELNLIRALQTGFNDLTPFFTRPWALFFAILAVFSAIYPWYERAREEGRRWTLAYSPCIAFALSGPLSMMEGWFRPSLGIGLVALAGIILWRRFRGPQSMAPHDVQPPDT